MNAVLSLDNLTVYYDRHPAVHQRIDRHFPITVLDVLLFGHRQRIGALDGVTTELQAKAVAVLAAVGLANFQSSTLIQATDTYATSLQPLPA